MPVHRSRARRFFSLACHFWSGETRGRAWFLTATVLAFVAAQIVVAVGINNWNRQFFDALETRDVGAIWAVVVRLLLQRPDIIIMDEATSALDEESQTSLMLLFDVELRHATVISVGHRASLDRFHDRKITMMKMPGGATLTSARLSRSSQYVGMEALAARP